MDSDLLTILSKDQKEKLIYLFMTCSVTKIGIRQQKIIVEYITPDGEVRIEII